MAFEKPSPFQNFEKIVYCSRSKDIVFGLFRSSSFSEFFLDEEILLIRSRFLDADWRFFRSKIRLFDSKIVFFFSLFCKISFSLLRIKNQNRHKNENKIKTAVESQKNDVCFISFAQVREVFKTRWTFIRNVNFVSEIDFP